MGQALVSLWELRLREWHVTEKMAMKLRDCFIFLFREYDLIPITGIRKIVANRLSIAKKTIPHFYLERSVHSDRLIKLRAELNSDISRRRAELQNVCMTCEIIRAKLFS